MTMSDKKCKVCGAPAELVYDDEPFCEYCLCCTVGLREIVPPRRCDQCGMLIKGSYFLDDDGDAFCSRDCALENWCAAKSVQGDN